MKVIVSFSGGKDSLAALLWTREHITNNFTTVFCDTGWEHPLTYEYIHRIADKLHLDLVTLKSKKYDGMVDLARQKKRWPSVRARFCTEELKIKPTIDYVLDEVQDNMLMIHCFLNRSRPSALQSLFGMNRRNENGQYCGFSSYSWYCASLSKQTSRYALS